MKWTRDEVLLALHLYERIPFGRQHSRNPEVCALASRLGRTPGSVAMKLNNLTSLDPDEAVRGVRGLQGASRLDRGLVTFDDEQRLVIGRRLRDALGRDEMSRSFLHTEGVRLSEPVRRALDPGLLARQRVRFLVVEAA